MWRCFEQQSCCTGNALSEILSSSYPRSLSNFNAREDDAIMQPVTRIEPKYNIVSLPLSLIVVLVLHFFSTIDLHNLTATFHSAPTIRVVYTG